MFAFDSHSNLDFLKQIQGVVFDVDGVLFDSRKSNILYYNLIRDAVGLPPITKEEADYCNMSTVYQAFQHIIPQHLQEKAKLASKTINYQEQILPMLIPEQGLLEALHWLDAAGLKLAICTNRINSVQNLLRYFSLQDFFSPIITAENSPPKPSPDGLLSIAEKWKIAVHQMVFIGDSEVDQLAANAASMPFIAFKNKELSPTLHVSDYFELLNIFGVYLKPLEE